MKKLEWHQEIQMCLAKNFSYMYIVFICIYIALSKQHVVLKSTPDNILMI